MLFLPVLRLAPFAAVEDLPTAPALNRRPHQSLAAQAAHNALHREQLGHLLWLAADVRVAECVAPKFLEFALELFFCGVALFGCRHFLDSGV